MPEKLIFLFLLCSITSTHAHHKRISKLNTLPDDDDMLLLWRDEKAAKCKPFTAFFKSCNKCFCSAEGVPSCTRIYCQGDDDDFTVEERVVAEEHNSFQGHNLASKLRDTHLSQFQSHEREQPVARYHPKRRRRRRRKRRARRKWTTIDSDARVNYNIEDNFINYD